MGECVSLVNANFGDSEESGDKQLSDPPSQDPGLCWETLYFPKTVAAEGGSKKIRKYSVNPRENETFQNIV